VLVCVAKQTNTELVGKPILVSTTEEDAPMDEDEPEGMTFDENALKELIQEEGTLVYSASYDGGSPMHTGTAHVIKFAKRFWAFDDDGGFGGPYKSLLSALSEAHVCFGDVQVWVHVSGLSAATIAGCLSLEAPIGHVVKINGEEWVLGKEGLSRKKPTARKPTSRRKRKAKS
jgi:hypothetical protein